MNNNSNIIENFTYSNILNVTLGHFDGDGHYQFKKDNDLKDNWLDNIDWIKVKKDSNYKQKNNTTDDIVSSSDDEDEEKAEMQARKERFNIVESYKEILVFMQPQESINRTLQRLNKSKTKMTTAQRFKMKKAGVIDESSENITKITGIVNEILTQTGNMDVYEETYEDIKTKIKEQEDKQQAGPSKAAELDMYADDFDEKEVGKLNTDTSTTESKTENNELMWEYKVSQTDTDDKIIGPFTTVVMQKKVESGDFKECVFVRKVIKDRKDDDDSRFYSSARMDFELYL